MLLSVIGLVMPLFGIIFLGYLSGRLKGIAIDGLAWLNFFVVYIALPPLFFLILVDTPFEEFGNARFLISTTLGTFAIFILGFVLVRYLWRDSIQNATIQGLASAYGNIGYLAPPLAIAAFGPEAAVPVALIFSLDNSLHFIMAPTMMTIGGSRRDSIARLVLGVFRSILTHPFIIATICGILGAYFQLQVAEPVHRFLTTLAQAAAPCALFALGVTAALRPLKKIPSSLSLLIPLKLLVHPVLMYLLVSPIPGLPPVWLHTAVLLAALPTATNVFVIAQQYGFWQERASSAVVLSTLISMVTVTGYLYLVKIGTI